MSVSYPADTSAAALRLFAAWLGSHYARSTSVAAQSASGDVLRAGITIGRRWELAVTLLNTLAPETTLEYDAARAAIESRLDGAALKLGVWAPRGAPLPSSEPALSEFALAAENAVALPDGRLEIRRPVTLHLRRASREGSVVTILGGLSAHWAQFTNRVPGSFQLNALALHRLPASEADREALAERIVLAAAQPDVEESVSVPAEDAWTATALDEPGSTVFGSPRPDSDDTSAALRRTVRRLLAEAGHPAQSPSALVLLGAATYAEEEKLSWVIRGIDPSVYSGYDIVAVIADGLVKPLLEPRRQTLPWDAPLS